MYQTFLKDLFILERVHTLKCGGAEGERVLRRFCGEHGALERD